MRLYAGPVGDSLPTAAAASGTGKWDHKGKAEMMMPYIKQLRAAVRHLLGSRHQGDEARAKFQGKRAGRLPRAVRAPPREADIRRSRLLVPPLVLPAAELEAATAALNGELSRVRAKEADLKAEVRKRAARPAPPPPLVLLLLRVPSAAANARWLPL